MGGYKVERNDVNPLKKTFFLYFEPLASKFEKSANKSKKYGNC